MIILTLERYIQNLLLKYQSLQMFAYPSTLELMKQSKPFKVMAALSIFCFLAGLTLILLSPFTNCGYQTLLPNNCQDLSSDCPYTCPEYHLTFCCQWNSSRGDYTKCFLKPEIPRVEKHDKPCKAVRIVGTVLLGLCFVLKIATIAVFMKLKKQYKQNCQVLQRIYYVPPTPVYTSLSSRQGTGRRPLPESGARVPQMKNRGREEDFLRLNPSVNADQIIKQELSQ